MSQTLFIMRHILNLIAPPLVDKALIVQNLNELLPHYELLAIEEFRKKQKRNADEVETNAWRELWLAALQTEYAIVVTEGDSVHLEMMLERLWRAPGTHIFTLTLEPSSLAPQQVAARIVQNLPEDFKE